ncbi:MAG: helix-turn-helix domain-containing protein [Solirubrobacteraceae bacterium]
MPPRRASPRPQRALGEAIREARKDRGLSQEAVALDAEMEPSWLSHIESGRRNPSWGTVQRIAAAIGVQVSELAHSAERIERDRQSEHAT